MNQAVVRAVPSLVLASASPRRRELLAQLVEPFDVCPSPLPEPEAKPARLSPFAWTEYLARYKAEGVRSRFPSAVILGADTIVLCSGEILNKPLDVDDAKRMLRLQLQQPSEVITGICVLLPADRPRVAHAVTRVWMRPDEAEMEAYLRTGDWRDKAGAYGIQTVGDRLVERIEGEFSNVVGLPLNRTRELLTAAGILCRPSAGAPIESS